MTPADLTTSNPASLFPHARARRRFAGFVLDAMVLLYVWAVVTDVVAASDRFGVRQVLVACFRLAWVIAWGAIGFAAGSALVGIRIVDENGNRPGFARSMKRSLVPSTIWIVTRLLLLLYFPPTPEIDSYVEAHDLGGSDRSLLFVLFGAANGVDFAYGLPLNTPADMT